MTDPKDFVTQSLASRYGSAPSGTDMTGLANETLATLLAHRSVRKFSPQPLPADALELIIAAAQSASTSSNLQCWTAISIENPERRSRLADIAGNQAWVRDCPVFIAWIVDLARLGRIGDANGRATDGLNYLESFVIGVVDTALAAQNAATAAESLGLGVTYIGALRNDPKAVAQELALPPRSFALFGMCLGYPEADDTAAIKPRLPLHAVLHRDQYRHDGLQEHVAAYDDTMAGFYSAQAMPARTNWSTHSTHRIRDARALLGRDVLRGVLTELGFELR